MILVDELAAETINGAGTHGSLLPLLQPYLGHVFFKLFLVVLHAGPRGRLIVGRGNDWVGNSIYISSESFCDGWQWDFKMLS